MDYTAQEINRIVAEIHHQLTITASTNVRWSWGAHSYQAILYRDMPALCFRVSGCLHKGWVIVCYNSGSDLYDIYFLNVRKQVVNVLTDIYCDILGRIIDEKVARPIWQTDEEYAKKARQDMQRKEC